MQYKTIWDSNHRLSLFTKTDPCLPCQKYEFSTKEVIPQDTSYTEEKDTSTISIFVAAHAYYTECIEAADDYANKLILAQIKTVDKS